MGAELEAEASAAAELSPPPSPVVVVSIAVAEESLLLSPSAAVAVVASGPVVRGSLTSAVEVWDTSEGGTLEDSSPATRLPASDRLREACISVLLSPSLSSELSLSVVDAATVDAAAPPLTGAAGWVGICREEISGAKVSEGLGEEWMEEGGGGMVDVEFTGPDDEFSAGPLASPLEAVVVVVGANWDTVLDSSWARELAREAV